MSADRTIIGCILAGGQSRRMGGGDKTLKRLGDRPMLDHVIDRLAAQVPSLFLNANGDPKRLAAFGLPVVADRITGYAGPLAGLSAAMTWAAEKHPNATHLITVAADTPFFPHDLANRLDAAQARPEGIAMATSGGHRHPVFALWPLSLRHHLADWMAETDTYKVIVWARLHALALVDFPMIPTEAGTIDPFFNVNTPEDLSTAETLLGQIPAGHARENT